MYDLKQSTFCIELKDRNRPNRNKMGTIFRNIWNEIN